MKINRRDLLKMGGGVAAGMVLGGGIWRLTQSPSSGQGLQPGVEQWVPTVCAQCMGGCGILVRRIDGWAVNIVGNPLHPVNRGTLCPKGIAGLQGLYDPDRIRTPLKRLGKRGEGRWQPISWEEAVSTVTESLKKLRQNGEPHRLAVLGGRYRGLMRSLWERFLEAFGSPNYIDNQFQWEGATAEGLYLTQGIYSPPAHDFENARYILSFGSNFLESYWSPVQALRGYGQFRRGRPEQRGRLVQIESRLSVTGMKADEWIPTPPGTESLVALAIANMIIREALYNSDFITTYAFGFEGWKDADGKEQIGFKEFVLSEYVPDVISKQTGISVDTFIRLAREFASNQPALAIGFRDRPFHQMAVSALNGLAGSVDTPGGVLAPRPVPLQTLPPFGKDHVAAKGSQAERIDGQKSSSMLQEPYLFAGNLISGKPYRPEVLFLYYTNPLFSNPNPDLFSKAFSEVPLIVSFSPYLDDSTSLADLILPDCTPLERWQDDPVTTNRGFPVLGIRQPVVEPLYQTRATGDVLLQITKSLGGEIEKAFPWLNFKEVILYGIRGVFDAKRGDAFGLQFEQSWTRLLEKGGWWAPSYKTFEEFWKQLQDKGGWWDPVYDFREQDRIFKTASKKFEFYAQKFKESVKGSSVSSRLKEASFYPHWEGSQQTGDEKEYPLQLNVFKTLALPGGRNANQPWLQAITGEYLFERWETWAEISPEMANRLGISDRDWIWVESKKGKVKARARVYKGALPDVVSIPFGEGHQSGGRWTSGLGAAPYNLLGDELDPLTGYPVSGATRVKIYKV